MAIDWWTLGLQAVNVTVLIWLLARFFWRPVAEVIEQRRETARRVLAEADAERGKAQGALEEIEKTRQGFEREREEIIAAAREAAEHERAMLLEAATKEAERLLASARADVEKDRQAADRAWTERASRLAVEIAGRLIAPLNSAAVSAAFLEWLLREIRQLPVAMRQAMAADGVVLEAVSATPIAPADQPRYRQMIGEAFGGAPDIRFRADPALIAGLELHGPHLIVSNSWRSDLAAILAGLTDDKRP